MEARGFQQSFINSKLDEFNMASEAETTQPEKPVYKKIVEYKKKISLVEGKRRAMFNKYEQEKTFNREKERVLDTELKVCTLFNKSTNVGNSWLTVP